MRATKGRGSRGVVVAVGMRAVGDIGPAAPHAVHVNRVQHLVEERTGNRAATEWQGVFSAVDQAPQAAGHMS